MLHFVLALRYTIQTIRYAMNKILAVISYALIATILLHSCHKKSNEIIQTTQYGSYLKNGLSIPIQVQNGFQFIWGNADTTFISNKQLIPPGGMLKYTPYPETLTGVTTPRTSVAQPANTLWITINEKVKRDYRCNTKTSNNADSCEKDTVNFFNPQSSNWATIKHLQKDSVSRIYTINRNDSLEAQ